jgi:hypothetical protein
MSEFEKHLKDLHLACKTEFEFEKHLKGLGLACKTEFGDSIYSNMWYCDNKNKICITFTPRGGCSISFQLYLDLLGLLNDALNYNPFVHDYRCDIFEKHVVYCDINQLVNDGYTFIKFIMNPYIRAVSIYRAQNSHNLSFREYLIQLVNNEWDYYNENDKYHLHPQYICGEENIITKYVKIDKNETFNITLFDGTPYTLDVNKYSSIHHGIKNKDNVTFCGDMSKDVINANLPKSYKYFYDDEIKKMVETFYIKDIEHYGYSFNDFE